jgi:hypothetical protein
VKRILVCAALVAALIPSVARADEAAALANRLAIEQSIDCLTTLAVLHQGGYERNPLAAPFAGSVGRTFGAALALNLLLRHAPVRLLRTAVYIYPVVLLGNVAAMQVQPFNGYVPLREPARARP